MALPTSFYSETIADNTLKSNGTPETGSWEVAITPITSGNIVAVTSALNDLAIARAGLSLGRIQQTNEVSKRIKSEAIPSSNPLAQRENKFLVRYHDAVTFQKMRTSIPTADLSKLMTNSEFVDLTGGDGATFKTAFEAVVKSNYDDTHAVIVDSIQFVGRNT